MQRTRRHYQHIDFVWTCPHCKTKHLPHQILMLDGANMKCRERGKPFPRGASAILGEVN